VPEARAAGAGHTLAHDDPAIRGDSRCSARARVVLGTCGMHPVSRWLVVASGAWLSACGGVAQSGSPGGGGANDGGAIPDGSSAHEGGGGITADGGGTTAHEGSGAAPEAGAPTEGGPDLCANSNCGDPAGFVCDPATGVCVECLQDSECHGTLTSGNLKAVCLPDHTCGCASDASCVARWEGTRCIASTHQCGCTGNADCIVPGSLTCSASGTCGP
jgi:hypothetical protein